MDVRVVFLGPLAERFGGRERLVGAPEQGFKLDELKALLTLGREELRPSLEPPVRAAVDREFVTGDAGVQPGQEVAFLPPFSGG